MEENKITISLKEFIELYEGQKERNVEFQILLNLVFEDTKLTSNKKDLNFDFYNSNLMRFLKEKYPEKYAKQVEILKKEEDEE